MRQMRDIINGYAEDLNDPLFKTWKATQLLRYHNEGLCFIAGMDPASFTKQTDITLPANEDVLPKDCGCTKVYNVLGEVNKYGVIETIPQKKEVDAFSRFKTPKKPVPTLVAKPVHTFRIDNKTKTVTIQPKSPTTRVIRVECAYLPQHQTLDEEVSDILCTHLSLLRHYVLAQAKMVDIIGGVENQEAAIHYKIFTEQLALLLSADTKYVKTALLNKNSDTTQG